MAAGKVLVLMMICVVGSDAAQVFTAGNLVETMKNLNLSVLVGYLEKTGLDKVLATVNVATVFAPTDDAFKNFRGPNLDVEALAVVLKGHVVGGYFNSTVAVEQKKLPSLNGGSPLIITSYNFTKPVVTANGAPVSTPDQTAINGIIHIVDRVIYPQASGDALGTLSNVASVSYGFIKSVPAVLNLFGMPGFTLFIPSNAAWTRVPYEVLSKLSNERDRELLMNHMVAPEPFAGDGKGKSGPFFAVGLTQLKTIKTVSATVSLNISQDASGGVRINGSQVIAADIPTSDGCVIHIINDVLWQGLPTL